MKKRKKSNEIGILPKGYREFTGAILLMVGVMILIVSIAQIREPTFTGRSTHFDKEITNSVLPIESALNYGWVWVLIIIVILGVISVVAYELGHRPHKLRHLRHHIEGQALLEMQKNVNMLKAKGYSESDIREVLKKKGWEEDIIIKLFK